jgi:hypothetical protein
MACAPASLPLCSKLLEDKVAGMQKDLSEVLRLCRRRSPCLHQ